VGPLTLRQIAAQVNALVDAEGHANR